VRSRKNPAPYVIKPLGEVQNLKRLLYVGREDDGSDVVEVLRVYEKAWGHLTKGFQLQRRVGGVEVAICGFFDGNGFVEPIELDFEHEKLFPGNIGPWTGEMGTSVFWAGKNRLFRETLGKVEEWLAEKGYVGSTDLNCIVNADGVHPLEFTPRFGYPTVVLQEESFEPPTGEFFYDLAQGNDPEPGASVDGQWRAAGGSGMPIVVTGKGETMQEAREQAHGRIENIVIPNLYYRDDIGERWIQGDGDRLLAWGISGPE
jgi:phosphoribosylamine--glycine ligase